MGTKRAHHNQDDADSPARKRRALYTEQDKKLAQAYSDLADELPSTRLAAAAEIIRSVAAAEDSSAAYHVAVSRLSKGVCSGRKAARLGFSVALTELFRFDNSIPLSDQIATILDASKVEGNVSAQEKRDTLLGRRFAFQALLESGVASSERCSKEDWKLLIERIADLAAEQPNLRKECSAIIYELLVGSQHKTLPLARVQQITDTWTERSLWKSPEGIALWLALSAFDGIKLPKHIWHHRDPFSEKERLILVKVMQDVASDDETQTGKKGDTSGARRISPSFAWNVVLAKLWSSPSVSAFQDFYKSAVDGGFFGQSASAERKHFGLHIINIIVREAPIAVLPSIFSKNVARCIINHSSHEHSYLSTTCKLTIDQIVARSLKDHEAATAFATGMLNAAVNFDQLTKTKAVATILAVAAPIGKLEAIQMLEQKVTALHGKTDKDAENQFRLIGDTMLSIFRTQNEVGSFFDIETTTLEAWAELALKAMSSIALLPTSSQQASAATKSIYWNRLMSCFGCILNFPVKYSATAVTTLLKTASKSSHDTGKGDESEATTLLAKARSSIKRSQATAAKGLGKDANNHYALQLMIGMSALQVYGNEPDAVPLLEDLLTAVGAKNSSDESTTMLVEIVLSFVSKSSVAYKKLAEQTFTALVPSLTEDSLQSLLDILEQKEGKSGQQALFADQAETEVTVRAGASDDNEDMLDVEEDSDIEIVNGVVAEQDDGSDESDDASDDDESDSEIEVEEGDEDEEAAFDRKLAEALGTSGFDDSGDDDSDMDDEQMLALEPHLAKIFQERSKVTSTKQDNKDARENIIVFKSRVLDLLSIYVKSQYGNPIVLALIQPLLALSRTSSNKQITEKATGVLKQLYDATNKDKSQSLKDAERLITTLTEIHEEVQQGGSKLHGNACSRSSLFLVKALLAIDTKYFSQVSEMYNELQQKWYLDPKSKVHGSFFTEWTSWLLTTKK